MADLEKTVSKLTRHGFLVRVAADEQEAAGFIEEQFDTFCNRMSPAVQMGYKPVVSYGDSMTLYAIDQCCGENRPGLLAEMKTRPGILFLDGFRKESSREEKLEIRRRAILSDFYMTGVNAISEEGSLFWVDMVGNRVASVAMGAREVIIVAGVNKIVPANADLDTRVRNIAGPENIARHPGFKTPCAKTGVCMDCSSPDRICNERLQMDRCYPQGRITLILIKKELGL